MIAKMEIFCVGQGITFDNCIFDFSSSDKLDGIQLQLSQANSPTSKAFIKEK